MKNDIDKELDYGFLVHRKQLLVSPRDKYRCIIEIYLINNLLPGYRYEQQSVSAIKTVISICMRYMQLCFPLTHYSAMSVRICLLHFIFIIKSEQHEALGFAYNQVTKQWYALYALYVLLNSKSVFYQLSLAPYLARLYLEIFCTM